MMIDIDHSKHLRQLHGQMAGDEVLRIVGLRLANAMRSRGLPTRFGGEEFVVLMPGVAQHAPTAAEEYRAGFDRAGLATTVGTLRITMRPESTNFRSAARRAPSSAPPTRRCISPRPAAATGSRFSRLNR
jgi:GGDEF domain-containing protein